MGKIDFDNFVANFINIGEKMPKGRDVHLESLVNIFKLILAKQNLKAVNGEIVPSETTKLKVKCTYDFEDFKSGFIYYCMKDEIGVTWVYDDNGKGYVLQFVSANFEFID